MRLENWVHHTIGTACGDAAATASLSRADVQRYQLRMLNRTLRYCREHSSFYAELFRSAGAPAKDIAGLGDLARFPLTEPQYLSDGPYRFLCTSQAEVARPYTFITSGTTGPKKKIFWTQGDLNRIVAFMAAGIGTVADPGDAVLVLLPDGRPNSQSDLLRQGVAAMGARPVVAESDISADEFMAALESSRCRVVFGYTRKIFRLSKELGRRTDLRKFGVRVLFLASEYLPPGMRRELSRLWGCDIRTHYGLTEMGLGVAVECEAHDGLHFNEADLLLEVVDPSTGLSLPPGEEGELVFTTLTREAMPLIRYRTHDLSRVRREPCPCGQHGLLRIETVRKRLESTAPFGQGGEIHPALLDDILFEIPGLVDYQAVATREHGIDRLGFKIEMVPEQTGRISEIRAKLAAAPPFAGHLAARGMFEPEIELVPYGSLQTVGRAKKLIVDRR